MIATPPTLSAEQLSDYHRDGFLLVPDVFPTSELVTMNEEIERIRALDSPDGANQRDTMLRLGLKSELTSRMCRDERVLDLLTDIVTPGIAIYSSKLFEKHPHDQTICHWHQDDAYFRQHSLCDCRMSVWIPLQDCDETNGCVWVVPGSHKEGLQPASYIGEETGHCELALAEGDAVIAGAVPVPMQMGSVLLFHALTWHRSLANNSPRPRRAFITSYQDAITSCGNEDQHEILRPAT
jgi:ectoine hydroxylase-related dioxygenase (phytanoyl-CoA dioxygenase family)